MRITAQLVDGATNDHVWAERYDRDLTDIFALQDEISQAIVNAWKLETSATREAEIARRTESVEAYDLYLMARQYWLLGNAGDARKADPMIRLWRGRPRLRPGLGAHGVRTVVVEQCSDERATTDGGARTGSALDPS